MKSDKKNGVRVQNKNLYVGISTLPHAGNGLFTKKAIKKNQVVCYFSGDLISEEEAAKLSNGERGHYFIQLSSGKILDTYNSDSFAKWANDAKDTRRNNCQIFSTENGNKAYISAIKNIEAKSEILVSYGDQFWEAVSFSDV